MSDEAILYEIQKQIRDVFEVQLKFVSNDNLKLELIHQCSQTLRSLFELSVDSF